MTSRDVRDILELGAAPTPGLQPAASSSRPSGPPGPPAKRLGGIARELFALIGDNAPTLALAQPVKPKFKERTKQRERVPAVRWHHVGFTVPSRANPAVGVETDRASDREHDARKRLVLRHWAKDLPANYVDGLPDTKFAKFNTSSQPFSYTPDEYHRWLQGASPLSLVYSSSSCADAPDARLQPTAGARTRPTTCSTSRNCTTCASSSWPTGGSSRPHETSMCVPPFSLSLLTPSLGLQS